MIHYIASLVIEFFTTVNYFLLAAIGLIIILGMMDIINLAHGEFMMIGAYIATISYHSGIPFLLAIVLSFLGTAIFGIIFEKLFLRHFYENKLNAMVLTFGLSLIISQGALIIFGPYMPSIPIPFGSFAFGAYSYSIYRIFLIVVGFLIVAVLWQLLNRTRSGMYARATMQKAEIANSLGINTNSIYSLTFSLGSGLAGLGGALLAPIMAITPEMGTQLIAPSFITVVVGGAVQPILGALGSSFLLSFIETPVGRIYGAYIGRLALLMAALVIIRIFPNGVSGYLSKFKS